MEDLPRSKPTRVSAAGLKAPARRIDWPAPVPPSIASAPRRSAAGLTVLKRKLAAKPSSAPGKTRRRQTKNFALYDRLRTLRDAIKPSSNQPELAIALIEACITEGICTKSGIVSTLVYLHLSNKFAGAMINSGLKAGRWWKDADGRYHLPVKM